MRPPRLCSKSIIGFIQAATPSCAVCHQVTVRAGNFIHSSPRTQWAQNPAVADYLIRFLRGTNYPVQVTGNPYYPSLLTSNQAGAAE